MRLYTEVDLVSPHVVEVVVGNARIDQGEGVALIIGLGWVVRRPVVRQATRGGQVEDAVVVGVVVGVSVLVGVFVGVGVLVGVSLFVGVAVFVNVGVGVGVEVSVLVGV
jgi:hypothetical protein